MGLTRRRVVNSVLTTFIGPTSHCHDKKIIQTPIFCHDTGYRNAVVVAMVSSGPYYDSYATRRHGYVGRQHEMGASAVANAIASAR